MKPASLPTTQMQWSLVAALWYTSKSTAVLEAISKSEKALQLMKLAPASYVLHPATMLGVP